MPAKTKKTKKAKKTKRVTKPAVRASAKKAKKTKKSAAKKPAKAAKKSTAKKTVKKHDQGKRKPAKTSLKKAAKKQIPTAAIERTAWKISPEISQSIFKIDTWKKGDLTIEHLNVYRSGWIVVDQLPDLSRYNPEEGVNVFEEFEFEEHQLHDASREASIFSDELPAEERNRLLALSEAELVDEGWTLDSVTRFKGPLVVEEV